MPKTKDGVTYARGTVHFDGMSWPRADIEMDRLEYTLRYGEPSRLDLLFVASVLGAYRALVWAPESKRQLVIAEIRRAVIELPVPKEVEASNG